MNVCIFLGPTVPVEKAAKVLDAVYLPPAAQGDVYLAAIDGAEAIGIVDGYFQGAPSVWHKEILWAMSRGVHVFGSASMGALRAAELSVFGMQGVGRIFEAYRDGVITDDDEVAVVHGPEEMRYRATTVPLVNIRATLARALEQELITAPAHRVLTDMARSLFYWDRSYDALIKKCEAWVEESILERFAAWVSGNAVDQKHDDAIEMLERMGELPDGLLQVAYQFQHTNAWDDLVEYAHGRVDDEPPGPLVEPADRVLDELRLEPLLYRRILAASSSSASDSFSTAQSPDSLVVGLRESGHYEQLAARSAHKRRLLNAEYGDLPGYADALLTPGEVLEWYFEDCCGISVPMDLEDYAKEMGISSSGELCRLLLHELLYDMTRDGGQIDGAPI
jgi:hypothetical protein